MSGEEGRQPRRTLGEIVLVSILALFAIGIEIFIGAAVGLIVSSHPDEAGLETTFAIVKFAFVAIWVAALIGILWAWAQVSPLVIVVPVVALVLVWLLQAVVQAVIPYSLGIGY
jgi:hypothetical protein